MAKNRTSEINQYKREHLKRIPLEVKNEKYEQIKKHTESTNETVSGFIKRAIDETMENDISNKTNE